MGKERIISKGKYTRQQPSGLIAAKQYIFVRNEEGQRRLLLRLANEGQEVCTSFAFVVYKLDVKGTVLGQERLECNGSFAPGVSFAYEREIEVPEKCTDVIVNVEYARYGSYTHHVENGEVSVSFGEKETNNALARSGAKHRSRRVHTRGFQLSWMFVLVAVIALACVFAASGYLLRDFQEAEPDFTLSGVNYEFVDANEKTDVVIVGCSDNFREITLQNEVEGHRVVGIKSGAFKKNSNLYRVTVDGINIDSEAFKSCSDLESVVIRNVTSIGANAFADCDSLESVTVTEGKKGQVLSLGSRAFADCKSLKEVKINQTVAYGQRVDYFKGSSGVEVLELKNFAYEIKGVEHRNVTKIAELFGLDPNGKISLKLKSLQIENMDSIPADFVKGFARLTSFKTSSKITVIGTRAFDGCGKLSEVSYKGKPTTIGSYAFAATAIKSFDMSGVASLGTHVFYACVNLTDVVGYGVGGIDTVPASTFEACASLESFVIKEGVKTVSDYAFKESGLKKFTLPEGVSFGKGILYGCNKLSELDVYSLGESGYVAYFFTDGSNMSVEQLAKKVPKSLKTVTLGSGTEINDLAFAGCAGVERINLPEGVVSFGDYAFAGCVGLKTIELPVSTLKSIGSYAFMDTKIESIEISSQVEYIGVGALSGCNSLRSLTIPFLGESANDSDGTIKHIFGGDNAEVPQSLGTISLVPGRTMVTLPDYAFAGCGGAATINIPSTISVVGNCAFLDCKSLAYIDLSGVTSLGERAFAGCSAVTYVHLSSALHTVGAGAFKNTGLTVLELPSDVKVIGFGIVEGCNKLVSLTTPFLGSSYESVDDATVAYLFGISSGTQEGIPTSLTSINVTKAFVGEKIPSYAFYGCKGATSIMVKDGYTTIGDYSFYGCEALGAFDFGGVSSLGEGAFAKTGIKSASLDAVRKIKPYTFDGCKSLTRVTLSEGLTSIGEWAFNDTAIVEIELPNGLAEIGTKAFGGAPLEAIVVPSTVEYLDSYAFYGCDKIRSISFPFTEDFGAINSYPMVSYHLFGGEFPTTLKSITINHSYLSVIYADAFAYSMDVEEIIIDGEINEIWSGAFYGCPKLGFVSLPSSVWYVDTSAFGGCYRLYEIATQLTDVYLSDSLICLSPSYDDRAPRVTTQGGYTYALFNNEWYLVGYSSNNIVTPDVGTYEGQSIDRFNIPAFLFYSDYTIEGVNLPLGVASVGKKAFKDCDNLQYVTFDKNSRVEIISESAFNHCDMLSSVVLPDSVKAISDYAFSNCSGLHSVDMPRSLVTIGTGAFEGCYALGEIRLYSYVEGIGDNAFSGCNNLYDVYNESRLNIVPGAKSYGQVARRAVKVHTDMTEAPSTEVYVDGIGTFRKSGSAWLLISGEGAEVLALDTFKYGDETVRSFRIAERAFSYNGSIRELTVGSAVTQIQEYAFESCYGLVKADLSACGDLTEIEEGVFSECQSLVEVKLPSGITSIGEGAFKYAHRLLKVEMPQKLESIGAYAFYDCARLISITIGENVRQIGENAFEYCNNLYEVYDLTPHLNIVKGASSNGYVGSYASAVLTSKSDALERRSTGGLELIKAFGNWYAYAYNGAGGEVLVIPTVGVKYEILASTFIGGDFRGVVMPSEVTAIEQNAFYDCFALSNIYFAGTPEQWESVSDRGDYSFYCNIYYYDECVHMDSYMEWTYDESGKPTTEICTESSKLTREPTCYEAGVVTYYCDCDGCDYTREVYTDRTEHSFDGDKCKICGATSVQLSKEKIEEMKQSGHLEMHNFEYDEGSGVISSTNKEDSSVGHFILMAETDMTLSFIYGASSEYGADYITVWIGEVSYGRLSGQNEALVNVDLAKGEILTVSYEKDNSVSNNEDRGYIYDLVLIVRSQETK